MGVLRGGCRIMRADFIRKAVCCYKGGLYYEGVCTKQRIFIWHFVLISVQ